MKIYTIWFGEYSDAYIDRVTTSKEKAEEFCMWYNSLGHYDTPRIEEYEVDDWEIESDDSIDKTVGYIFRFNYKNGKCGYGRENGIKSYRIPNSVERNYYWDSVAVEVWCPEDNLEKAQKIAQDEYMKWKYEHIEEL